MVSIDLVYHPVGIRESDFRKVPNFLLFCLVFLLLRRSNVGFSLVPYGVVSAGFVSASLIIPRRGGLWFCVNSELSESKFSTLARAGDSSVPVAVVSLTR
jgi:hypothetical protein